MNGWAYAFGAKALLWKDNDSFRNQKIQGQVGTPTPFLRPQYLFGLTVHWVGLAFSEAHTESFPSRLQRAHISYHSACLSKCNIPPWGASSPIPQLVFIHARNFNSVLGLTKWELCPPHKATTTSRFTESSEISQFTGGGGGEGETQTVKLVTWCLIDQTMRDWIGLLFNRLSCHVVATVSERFSSSFCFVFFFFLNTKIRAHQIEGWIANNVFSLNPWSH